MINDNLKLTGTLTIAINDKIVQKTENLVVTAGKEWVADRMNNANTVMTYMAIGTGTTVAAPANTTFDAATGGDMLARTVFSVVNKGADDSMTITWTVTVS